MASLRSKKESQLEMLSSLIAPKFSKQKSMKKREKRISACGNKCRGRKKANKRGFKPRLRSSSKLRPVLYKKKKSYLGTYQKV